ncbi:MAG: hypothetical protein JJ863_00055 [Deltaproteobacteria bacterium]|nr:hypothetical protein [Deltaproteobacteria bacterium]
MRRMTLCRACERHVYENEPACPFCGSSDERLAAARVRGRLGRAAGHAARAAMVVGVVACGSSTEVTDAGAEPDASVADAGPPDAGAEPDAAVADAGPPDAGVVADAGVEDAGEEEDAEVPTPLYGGVFPDPRKRAVV